MRAKVAASYLSAAELTGLWSLKLPAATMICSDREAMTASVKVLKGVSHQ